MIDTAKITIKAGKGGDGLVSFRREKYIPKGGPWGGDGGRGGDIIFKVDPHLSSLTPFRRQRTYNAENGKDGMTNLKKGRDGENLIVHVPAGTLIKNEQGELMFDLIEIGEEKVISQGGKGGLGNWHFKSSVNQAPRIAIDGVKVEPIILKLELKLIADVGIIGLPSSGKSTLLNALTRANAKTAEYHFTTLEPNLGVLVTQNFISNSTKDYILADIPGLIEGAADGKGLGHDFLKHVERTKILIHVIDGSEIMQGENKLKENYEVIQNELALWSKTLLNKAQILVVNKIDITEVKTAQAQIEKIFKPKKLTFVSAATGENLKELVSSIIETEKSNPHVEEEQIRAEISQKYSIDNLRNRRIIFREKKIEQE